MATISDFVDKEQPEGLTNFEEQLPVEQEPVQASGGFDLSFLKAQTGAGQVEDYMEHALNFNGSKAVARILRGLTGMVGELNYAIADIILGALEMLNSRKKVSQ